VRSRREEKSRSKAIYYQYTFSTLANRRKVFNIILTLKEPVRRAYRVVSAIG
jgi:hypothetical protein